jgi:drug/metabolite transporter (DMT)-like permease
MKTGPSKEAQVFTSAVLFALLAGTSAATWTICLKLGSTKINAALGAMMITGVAFLVNSVVLLVMRVNGHEIVLKREAFWLLAVAGIAAAGVDLFGLLAYERGLRVTSSFIIGGTSAALVLLVGFLALHEPVTWGRLLAIVLIATGILLLQTQGE